jgi:hypothetical protein
MLKEIITKDSKILDFYYEEHMIVKQLDINPIAFTHSISLKDIVDYCLLVKDNNNNFFKSIVFLSSIYGLSIFSCSFLAGIIILTKWIKGRVSLL